MPHRLRIFALFFTLLVATGCQIQDVKYHYTEAMQAEGQGKLADALKSYLEVLKLNERHFTALINTANIYLLQKQYPNAKKYYIRALLERTNHAPGYYGLGLVYHELKDPLRAQESFRRAVRFAPDLIPAWVMHGWSLHGEGKVQDAVKVLGEGLTANPTNTALRYNLGWLQYMRQQYTNALAPLREGAKLAPGDFELAVLLGKTLLKAGLGDEAAGVLERVRTLRKDHLFTRLLEGEYLAHRQEGDRAVALLTALAQEYPDSYQVHLLLGETYHRLKRHDDAVRYLILASQLDIQDPRPRLLMVDIYLLQKKSSLAMKELQQLRRTHPRDNDVLARLVRLYHDRQEWDRLIPAGKVLLARDAGNRDVLYSTGLALVKVDDPALQDLKLAATMLWKVLEQHKDDKAFLALLLDVLKQTGEVRKIRAVERLLGK